MEERREAEGREALRLPAKMAVWLIEVYRLAISSWTPPRCRFYPTCSQYMALAVEKHGLIKGFLMGMGRILRCHPLSEGGYDPVPER